MQLSRNRTLTPFWTCSSRAKYNDFKLASVLWRWNNPQGWVQLRPGGVLQSRHSIFQLELGRHDCNYFLTYDAHHEHLLYVPRQRWRQDICALPRWERKDTPRHLLVAHLLWQDASSDHHQPGSLKTRRSSHKVPSKAVSHWFRGRYEACKLELKNRWACYGSIYESKSFSEFV